MHMRPYDEYSCTRANVIRTCSECTHSSAPSKPRRQKPYMHALTRVNQLYRRSVEGCKVVIMEAWPLAKQPVVGLQIGSCSTISHHRIAAHPQLLHVLQVDAVQQTPSLSGAGAHKLRSLREPVMQPSVTLSDKTVASLSA
jgi:hypothetical protein